MECLKVLFRPLLFSLYILPFKNIISNFPSVKYLIFADDIQLYIELPVIANSSDNVALIDCINMVKNWILQNSLMLNMNKTQLLNISRTSSVFPFRICLLQLSSLILSQLFLAIMLKTLVLFLMIT